MNQKELIIGLKFVLRYSLSPGETEVLLKIIDTPMTAKEMVEDMGKSFSTTYHLLRNLLLKDLVYIGNFGEKKGKYYHFRESKME